MSRFAYVDGRYVRHAEASVHVEDRGYQFADGVYEVVAVRNGKFIDKVGHLDRLERSLAELRIAQPMTRKALEAVMAETIRKNRITDGIIYIQITRGVAKRDHPFPKYAQPVLVMTARGNLWHSVPYAEKGIKVVTMKDIRWGRCDIKSVSLLPNVLAKQAAKEAGAYEAWLVDDGGYVTEGSSTNAWILDQAGNVVTRAIGDDILAGITRQTLLKLAENVGIKIVERPFTGEEAKSAREAFLTSATTFCLPITEIDDTVIGNGHPGLVALKLRQLYIDHLENEAKR